VDYADCCGSAFNSLLTVSGGKAYANMKKISGEVCHVSYLMNITGGSLILKSDEINPSLMHECDGIPIFVLNSNSKLDIERLNICTNGCTNINSLFSITGNPEAYINVKEFDCSFSNINNDLIHISNSTVYFNITSFTPTISANSDSSALINIVNASDVYFNAVKIVPTFGESNAPRVFVISDTSSLHSQVQIINTASQVVNDLTSGVIDFDVKQCLSNTVAVLITSSALANHTYRGTYRTTGNGYVFQFNPSTEISGNPIFNSVVLVTNGDNSIGTNEAVTINNYVFLMANVTWVDLVSMLISANAVVNVGVY